MISLRTFILQTRDILAAANIPEPRLEAEIMLTDVLSIPRHQLYAVQDQNLLPDIKASLNNLIKRRVEREPLAYILGHREFYGIDLIVSPAVMIPRPETELLIERAMLICLERMDHEEPLVIADIGTGCGGICINLAIHIPQARIFATDLYPNVFEVTKANIRKHMVEERITLLHGDLLTPIDSMINVIVANLPYVPSLRLKHLSPEVQKEPREALDGGLDGLGIIQRLLLQATDKLSKDGIILLEVDPELVGQLKRIALKLFPDAITSVEQDLAGMDRIFVIERAHVEPTLS